MVGLDRSAVPLFASCRKRRLADHAYTCAEHGVSAESRRSRRKSRDCQTRVRRCNINEFHQIRGADKWIYLKENWREKSLILRLIGVFLLYHAWYSLLYVRAGHESRDPCGRKPEIYDDFNACRNIERRKDNRKKGCYERMLRLAIRQRRDIKFCSTNYSKNSLNDFCEYAIIKTIHTNHV